GTGMGQLRTIKTVDGRTIIERLDEVNPDARFYRYTLIVGIAALHYTGTLEVKSKGSGCIANWSVQFLADNQPDILVRAQVSTLLKTGLESLKARFGVGTPSNQ